jgi:hypothetical protein
VHGHGDLGYAAAVVAQGPEGQARSVPYSYAYNTAAASPHPRPTPQGLPPAPQAHA